jgi:hypothetical protein
MLGQCVGWMASHLLVLRARRIGVAEASLGLAPGGNGCRSSSDRRRRAFERVARVPAAVERDVALAEQREQAFALAVEAMLDEHRRLLVVESLQRARGLFVATRRARRARSRRVRATSGDPTNRPRARRR